VGRRNQVVDVAEGYGRNFLIKKGLGIFSDERAIGMKKEAEREEEARKARYEKEYEKIKSEGIEIAVSAGDRGQVFEGVNRERIEKELEQKGVKEEKVLLKQTIKKLGEEEIEVRWPMGVGGKVKLKIVRK